LKLNTY
ncbi:aconitase family protein, partial [Vibrio parahaemolyticus V-223/04]